MAGVVLSGNIIQLVFFWELTSLFSFLLIGYWYHRKDARRGARMALTVTGTGGLAMLVGMLVLGHIVGSYDLDNVLAAGRQIRDSHLYLLALVLILLGALTKALNFPSSSGCPMPWLRPRRCRPICTRPPWSRPACFCWHGCGRCWQTPMHGSGWWAEPAPDAADWRLLRDVPA
jgi:MFS family permease